uniref:Uncharacterized protein n=1 Tax=Aegilops tauschii subsp. strangulata TaxID=200361 RepID=A0A453GFH7_AEGTS
MSIFYHQWPMKSHHIKTHASLLIIPAKTSQINQLNYSTTFQMTAVKQEVDTTSDTSPITHDEPLCQKHNKPYEYIHRPR